MTAEQAVVDVAGPFGQTFINPILHAIPQTPRPKNYQCMNHCGERKASSEVAVLLFVFYGFDFGWNYFLIVSDRARRCF